MKNVTAIQIKMYIYNMRNIAFVFALLFFPPAFLFSCSSDDVKSSKNYIEDFDIDGISPIEISILQDQRLINIWTEPSNYETLKNKVRDKEPDIKVSPGASYSSADDWIEESFQYIVTAENGSTREYSVRIDTVIPRKYSFEIWTQPNGYYIPSGSNSRWTSGNEGIKYAFLVGNREYENPENYPTRKTTEGYAGNAVLLETIAGSTGGIAGKRPLFSGNLILGNFNFNVAKEKPLAAIEIGKIYPAKPKKVTGYYKYKEGDNIFISGENSVEISNRPDSCSMIVKFYRSDLPDGRDTILTVENIDESDLVIAETRKEDCSATAGEGFHLFELELVYKPGKEPDFQNHRYKLGMTFAASKDGDTFSGKIGSRLIVDEIEIVDF